MVVIASDHAGYELKEKVAAYLKSKGVQFADLGTDSDKSVDYPVFAEKLCNEILSGRAEKGILVCGTGIGMSIAANKFKGIRAAACSEVFSARLTRQHNDANVICFGARVIGEGTALDIVDAFLETEFEGGKHKKRVDMISEIEEKQHRA